MNFITEVSKSLFRALGVIIALCVFSLLLGVLVMLIQQCFNLGYRLMGGL